MIENLCVVGYTIDNEVFENLWIHIECIRSTIRILTLADSPFSVMWPGWVETPGGVSRAGFRARARSVIITYN